METSDQKGYSLKCLTTNYIYYLSSPNTFIAIEDAKSAGHMTGEQRKIREIKIFICQFFILHFFEPLERFSVSRVRNAFLSCICHNVHCTLCKAKHNVDFLSNLLAFGGKL